MIAARIGIGASIPVTVPPNSPENVVSAKTIAPAMAMLAATPPTDGADDERADPGVPSNKFIARSATNTAAIVSASVSLTSESSDAVARHAPMAPARESCHACDLEIAR